MKPFLIEGGVAHFGPNTKIGLSAAQVARRRDNLIVEDNKKGRFHVVTTRVAVQFKVGETVHLDELPKNLSGIVRPLQKAESKAEKIAEEKARARREVDKEAEAKLSKTPANKPEHSKAPPSAANAKKEE